MATGVVCQNFWADKSVYGDAEREHYEKLAKKSQIVEKENVPKEETIVTPVTPVAPVAPVAPVTPVAPVVPVAPVQSKGSRKKNRRNRESVSESKTDDESSKNNNSTPIIDTVVVSTVDEQIEPIKSKGVEETPKIDEKGNDKLQNVAKDNTPDKVIVKEDTNINPTVSKGNRKRNKKNSHSISESKSADNNKKDDVIVHTVVCVKLDDTESKPKEKVKDVNENEKGGRTQCSFAGEVAKAREHIKQSLECMDAVMASVPNDQLKSQVGMLSTLVQQLTLTVNEMSETIKDLQSEVKTLKENVRPPPFLAVCPMKLDPPPQAAVPKKVDDDDDDGVDLFGSDSEGEDAEAAKIREERLAAYAAKKSKKPVLIAKSSIVLDCKPWDDETDLAAMEVEIRKIATDGLLWGASKLVPIAYTIKKLQISCVIEDDKVSVDWLQEEIEKIEDYVQNVDIAAFNKI